MGIYKGKVKRGRRLSSYLKKKKKLHFIRQKTLLDPLYVNVYSSVLGMTRDIWKRKGSYYNKSLNLRKFQCFEYDAVSLVDVLQVEDDKYLPISRQA